MIGHCKLRKYLIQTSLLISSLFSIGAFADTSSISSSDSSRTASFLNTYIGYINALSTYPIGNEKPHHTALETFSMMYARKTCWQNAILALGETPPSFNQNTKKIFDDAELVAENMIQLLDTSIISIKNIIDGNQEESIGEKERKTAEITEKFGQAQTVYNYLTLRAYGEILDSIPDSKGIRHLRITLKEKKNAEHLLEFAYGKKLKNAPEASVMAYEAKMFYKFLSSTKAKDQL